MAERGEFELPVPIVNSQGRQRHGPSAIEEPLAYDTYQVCKAGLLAASAKAAKALDGAVRRDPVALLPNFSNGEPAFGGLEPKWADIQPALMPATVNPRLRRVLAESR